MAKKGPKLPSFCEPYGTLPPGDYPLTLNQLRGSILVTGKGVTNPQWNSAHRAYLVDRLEILVNHLWAAGIDRIFVDGSFVTDKGVPKDIDGYFEFNISRYSAFGSVYGLAALQGKLNQIDPEKCWGWDHRLRKPHPDSKKFGGELPMWHKYRVELYPHYPGAIAGFDKFGVPIEYPSWFRQTE